jgi:hypothetical protein
MSMKYINQYLQKIFPPHQPLPAGVYHYQAPPNSDFPYRLHLRIEKDGTSILIVNASTVLHLNETATEYAYHIIRETSQEEVVRSVNKRYHAQKDQIIQDYQDFRDRLKTLVEMPDLDPVTFLDFDRDTPYASDISAPYRLDCALTYAQMEDDAGSAAPTSRVDRELSSDEWKTIFNKAWEVGIPHIILTGGEPTLRPDLVELIAHAESIGLVTGLLTNGIRCEDKTYLQGLMASGLDHLMIILDPKNETGWKALETILPEDIFTTVHLTILSPNPDETISTVNRLNSMGVTSLSLSASDPAFHETLQQVRKYVETIPAFSLVWDLPVPYSRMNPVNLELANHQEAPQGAGKAWLYVEPDGDVLASQGMPEVLGNLLTDPWERIWKQ